MTRRRILVAIFIAIAGIKPSFSYAAEQVLTLSKAIHQALQNNLSVQLSKAATEAARGQTLQAAAGLLPRVTASLQQSRVFKVNLESQGFPSNNPAFNSLIGPFNSFDARLQLAQSLLDVSALRRAQAGRAQERAVRLQEQLAREQVAAATALAYLEALRSDRAVVAAEANVKLAYSLFQLAKDQRNAGVSTGVDVARAETRTAQENLRLIRHQVAAREAKLRLKRVVGLSLAQDVSLEELPLRGAEDLTPEKAIPLAHSSRVELQIAKGQLEAQTYQQQSTRAENYPSLRAAADYGYSGTVPSNTARTGRMGGMLELPIFSGGATRGRSQEAAARQQEASDRYADIQIQIEEDVRLAIQILQAEEEEVKTAGLAVALAQKELRMARERFAAGVGDNIQLLSAQTSLYQAEDDRIEAKARYDTARVNLASALGQAQLFQ